MKLAIFGANGQTGRLLTAAALGAGHAVTAITRQRDTFPALAGDLTVAEADARDPGSLTHVVTGADAVLSTMGVSFSREPIDLYSVGTTNIVNAMATAGPRRLVVVSSTGAFRDQRRGAPLTRFVVEPLLRATLAKTLYADVRRMETVLQQSGLDWTIVRPSGLVNIDHTTRYHAGEIPPAGTFTSRADLAHYVLAVAEHPETIGKTLTISTTEDTPSMWQMLRTEASP